MNTTDGELLRCYARDRSETAFGELVRRHINLVYSAALRQVNGDTHRAEDVTQSVFADLARKAAGLSRHPSLTGWLYTSTRFVAANQIRAERRRHARELQAHAMTTILSSQESEPETDWTQLRPMIDDAMHLLNEQDREAVLLRHFENRSYAQIASDLGLTENAARMRVERALEKLRGVLNKRGVGSTLAVLATLLAANAVTAAPAALSSKVLGASLAGAAAAGGASTFLSWLAASKMKLATAVGIAAAVAVTTEVATHHAFSQTAKAIPTILASAATASGAATPPNTPNQPGDSGMTAAAALPANGPVLHLQIVDAGTGNPIPSTPLEYRGWEGRTFHRETLQSDKSGVCDVPYSAGTTEFEITTRKEYYADTRLLWDPGQGDAIPTNYVLKLQRSTPIGGRVVDSAGNPIVGAKVGWNAQPNPSGLTHPESHEFGWVETLTDQDGRWQINHVADDMIERLYGSASASNFVSGMLTMVSRDKATEQELRAGTLVLQLGSGVTVHGLVTDASGTPVAGADVMVGLNGEAGRREGKTESDGTFAIAACRPGHNPVSADAPGYATSTVTVELADDTAPVHLVLHPGKTLRLAIKDSAGNPIPHAQVYLDNLPDRPRLVGSTAALPAQVEFRPRADSEGRVVWTNAPEGDLAFDAEAPGYMRVNDVKAQADGQEHVITLPTALTVHGTVTDETSGQPVSHFRMTIGWAQVNGWRGTTNIQWSTMNRFWLDFSGGAYSKSIEEQPIQGIDIPGYALKFTADGYAPFVSRVIGTNEGNVELDVTLHRAAATSVTVYGPDNQPLTGADVGFVTADGHVQINGTGLVKYDMNVTPIVHTSANGTFELPSDDTITRVIVASPSGFADAARSDLSGNAKIYLQPWGSLQVTCTADGQPVVGRTYHVAYGDITDRAVAFSYGTTDAQTDAQGKFTLSNLPPGTHTLSRSYISQEGAVTSTTFGSQTPIVITPGKTTTLNLGGSNYTVTARIQWPAGVQRQSQWRVIADLESDSSQGRTRPNPVIVNSDDTLSVDDVRPGKYGLSVNVLEPLSTTPGTVRSSLYFGGVIFTVPADPATGKMDAGAVTLQSAPAQQ